MATATAPRASAAAAFPRRILAFIGLAYAISWAWSLALIASGMTVQQGSGWPTHFPALIGPTVAAVALAAASRGRKGLRTLGRRVVRWRIGIGWWAAALAPLGFLGIGLVVAAPAGRLPSPHEFSLYSGWPALGLAGVALAALLNGFAEETGWRGYLLPALAEQMGRWRATFAVAAVWALWHLPLFFLLASYRGIAPFAIVGFLISIASGSIVASWLYYGSGESVAAVAVWHGAYNIAAATAASSGMVAGIASALVIGQALLLTRQRRARELLGVTSRVNTHIDTTEEGTMTNRAAY
jgi:membrane protease YdiL (CAAX protease family)